MIPKEAVKEIVDNVVNYVVGGNFNKDFFQGNEKALRDSYAVEHYSKAVSMMTGISEGEAEDMLVEKFKEELDFESFQKVLD